VSLRTKLLAVVVGLNGLILLLALALLLGSREGTPSAALAHLLRGTREEVGAHLARWDAHVDGVWLLEENSAAEDVRPTRDQPLAPSLEVYDAREWFRAPPAHKPLPLASGHGREIAVKAYGEARRPNGSLAMPGTVTALLEMQRDGRTRWALVAQVREADRGARGVYLVMIGGILLLGLVAYLVVSRLVVRPLAALTDAATRVAAGESGVRLEQRDRDDELGRTTAAFNRMAREIHEYQTHLEERVLAQLGQIKKTEQHLAIAERLAATGKLAAGIAHEINNPLAGMKNAVRALARGDLPAEKTAEYLELIHDGLQRVEETVKKVLSFTPRRVEPRPVDLAEVARKALALARHRIERRNVRVEGRSPPAGEAVVFGDPLELQHVALNLLLNAADAIDETKGGRIEIEVARTDDEVSLRVTDDGCGMSPEVQARCFDLFFTTKGVGEGTGLGLSVVYNIVVNHGGRIELVSAPGRGTTFTVRLPLEAAPAPAEAPRARESSAEPRP
jgi:signal transduction histidine kinase